MGTQDNRLKINYKSNETERSEMPIDDQESMQLLSHPQAMLKKKEEPKKLPFAQIDENFEDYPHPYALDDDMDPGFLAKGQPAFNIPVTLGQRDLPEEEDIYYDEEYFDGEDAGETRGNNFNF
jgi:hypothetical protein